MSVSRDVRPLREMNVLPHKWDVHVAMWPVPDVYDSIIVALVRRCGARLGRRSGLFYINTGSFQLSPASQTTPQTITNDRTRASICTLQNSYLVLWTYVHPHDDEECWGRMAERGWIRTRPEWPRRHRTSWPHAGRSPTSYDSHLIAAAHISQR